MARKRPVQVTMDIVAKIEEYRDRYPDMTNLEIAALCDVSDTTVSNALRGKLACQRDAAAAEAMRLSLMADGRFDESPAYGGAEIVAEAVRNLSDGVTLENLYAVMVETNQLLAVLSRLVLQSFVDTDKAGEDGFTEGVYAAIDLHEVRE